MAGDPDTEDELEAKANSLDIQKLKVERLKARNEQKKLDQADSFASRWGNLISTGVLVTLLSVVATGYTNCTNSNLATERLNSEEKRDLLNLYFDKVASTDMRDLAALQNLFVVATSVPVDDQTSQERHLTDALRRSFGERVTAITDLGDLENNPVSYREIAAIYPNDFLLSAYPLPRYEVHVLYPERCAKRVEDVQDYLEWIGFPNVSLKSSNSVPDTSDVRFRTPKQEDELEGLAARLGRKFDIEWTVNPDSSEANNLVVYVGKNYCNEAG